MSAQATGGTQISLNSLNRIHSLTVPWVCLRDGQGRLLGAEILRTCKILLLNALFASYNDPPELVLHTDLGFLCGILQIFRGVDLSPVASVSRKVRTDLGVSLRTYTAHQLMPYSYSDGALPIQSTLPYPRSHRTGVPSFISITLIIYRLSQLSSMSITDHILCEISISWLSVESLALQRLLAEH
jgi:hypothetical protein